MELLENIKKPGNIFDSHAHYDDEKFDGIRDRLLPALNSSGVCGIITCGCDIASTDNCIALAEKYDFVYAAAGFHPENLPQFAPDLSELKPRLQHKKVVALGEIGLDYHWDIDRDLQKQWFEAQLKLAIELDIPIIVHDRDAHGDTLELLKKYRPTGVVHCFSGSTEMAKEVLKLGMYIGVGGVITFKNARKTVEVAEMLPPDRLLLETDCPYLAPEPFRGRLCHSGLIAYTAEKIAEIRHTDTDTLLSQNRENVTRLFGI